MPSLRTKILLVLLSSAAAGALGLLLLRSRTSPSETATVDVVDARKELAAAFAEGSGRAYADAVPGGIPRRRIPERLAKNFFPSIGMGQVYDPDMIARRKPDSHLRQWFAEHPDKGWVVNANARGFREDREVASEKPDVRVLVVGDSHVDGVCTNAEAFPHVLERALAAEHPDRSIEILNGGTGGWSFYNYLGSLEAHSDLKPDVFVFVVYGGNDFYEAIPLHHYHRREPLPPSTPDSMTALVRLARENMGIPSQWFNQVVFFRDHPEERPVAIQMAVDVTAEMARQCDAVGIKLLAVYLPPYAHGQPARFASYEALARERIEVSDSDLLIDQELADAWLERIRVAGVRTVDLRPAFVASDEQLYWETDHHISLAGQRLVAREVHDAVAELAGLTR